MFRHRGIEDSATENGRNANALDYDEEEEDKEEYSIWNDLCRSLSALVYGEEEVGDAVKAFSPLVGSNTC